MCCVVVVWPEAESLGEVAGVWAEPGRGAWYTGLWLFCALCSVADSKT